MTLDSEQEFNLNSARSKLRQAMDLIDTLFAESADNKLEPADLDLDLSEIINKCNEVFEYLYDLKREATS